MVRLHRSCRCSGRNSFSGLRTETHARLFLAELKPNADLGCEGRRILQTFRRRCGSDLDRRKHARRAGSDLRRPADDRHGRSGDHQRAGAWLRSSRGCRRGEQDELYLCRLAVGQESRGSKRQAHRHQPDRHGFLSCGRVSAEAVASGLTAGPHHDSSSGHAGSKGSVVKFRRLRRDHRQSRP